MGQYHKPACLELGESLYSHRFGAGLKLMEWGFGGYGSMTSGLAMLLAPGGRWNGKRIVVVGDYAEVGDFPEDVPFAANPVALYETDEAEPSSLARSLVSEAFGCAYVEEPWSLSDQDGKVTTYTMVRGVEGDFSRLARLSANTEDDSHFGALYVVNRDKNEMLDPLAFGSGRNLPAIALRQAGVMLALAVLLAVSNGRGGGDFHCGGGRGHELVGSWGCDRVDIGPAEGATDISRSVKDLLWRYEGESIARFTKWDEPGSLPDWLKNKLAEEAASAS